MEPISAGIAAAGSIIGGLFDANNAAKNRALQKEFAQNSIQWKVADAKKAGIHPLYALGAQTHSFTPVHTGLGSSLADAGQSIGRAVDAYADRDNRLDGFVKASQALQLERGKLENDLLKVQIASAGATLTQPGTPPAAPPPANRYLIPGQGSAKISSGPLVQDRPMERVVSAPERPHQEPGAIPEVGFQKTRTGGYAVAPSSDAQQRMEDDILSQLAWAVRNRLGPMLGGSNLDPPFKAPPGQRWIFDPLNQEYRLKPSKKPERPSWFWN